MWVSICGFSQFYTEVTIQFLVFQVGTLCTYYYILFIIRTCNDQQQVQNFHRVLKSTDIQAAHREIKAMKMVRRRSRQTLRDMLRLCILKSRNHI